MNPQPKKATNLTLDASLIEEARSLEVNLSRAAEECLRLAVRQARADHWRAKNAKAPASSNCRPTAVFAGVIGLTVATRRA